MLELKNVCKSYPGVVALDDISLEFKKGEVHAIAGENGAGKSTLIKILSGAIKKDSGVIKFASEIIENISPHEALSLGISTIYQEFNLVPYLSIAENIFLGREPRRFGLIDKVKMHRMATDLCNDMGVSLDTRIQVKKLGVAYQQIVEILKAVSQDARVLIMDEPTAPLTGHEIGVLFRIVEKVRLKSVTIIYISHRLDEIFEICDRVSVIRDGKLVITKEIPDTNHKELISYMVGRDLNEIYPVREPVLGEEAVRVDSFSNAKLNNVSFNIRRGEILGISGLVGAGRTELARAIFGADQLWNGDLYISGKKITIKSPKDAIRNGIGLIPEDRKQQGVLLGMSIKQNISLPVLKKFSTFSILKKADEMAFCSRLSHDLRVKAPSLEQLVKNLSGGNQQKVVLAKWMATNSDVLIFDEPTRGIDIGAKQEIYQLINKFANDGKCVLMISSEMPELIGMADRILVMRGGENQGIVEKKDFSQEKLFILASGTKG